MLQQKDWDIRHLRFQWEGALNMRANSKVQNPFVRGFCEAQEAFDRIVENCSVQRVFSAEETGNRWSYQRDMRMAPWFRERGVDWLELPNKGVRRACRNRNGWDQAWRSYMNTSIREIPLRPLKVHRVDDLPDPTNDLRSKLEVPSDKMQKGGRTPGLRRLQAFFPLPIWVDIPG